MKIRSVEYVKASTRWDDGPRDGLPEIAMIGRSNVGKSSLINFLLNRRKAAYVSKTPGKTQLIQFFLINRSFYLVDLPGYGYARTSKVTQKSWGPMIENYLLKREALKGVSLLIDIRHPGSPLDTQMANWLDQHQLHTLFIATKGDKLKQGKRRLQADLIKQTFNLSSLIQTSSAKKQGRDAVWQGIEALVFPKAILMKPM